MRRPDTDEPLRIALSSQRGASATERGNGGDAPQPRRPPVQIVRLGHRECASDRSRLRHRHEPVRVCEREWTQQDCVRDSENGCDCTESHRECEHGHAGEPRARAELAQGVANILADILDPFRASHLAFPPFTDVTAHVAYACYVAELFAGRTSRLLGRHASHHEILLQHLEMVVELALHLLVDGGAPESSTKLARESAKWRHGAEGVSWARAGYARHLRRNAPIGPSRLRGAAGPLW